MERTLLALWDEDRQEVEVRRPSGQTFRFPVRQAEAGNHEVFAIETNGKDEVWLFTGPRGPQRPTRRVRFTHTGIYRGHSAV